MINLLKKGPQRGDPFAVMSSGMSHIMSSSGLHVILHYKTLINL